MEDAYARFTVPECVVLPDVDELDGVDELEGLDELLQPAAASAMQVMTISAAKAPRFLTGLATIVRP
jgi:hypothetical protein